LAGPKQRCNITELLTRFNQAAAGVYNQYHTLQCASQTSINLEVYDSKPSGRKSQSSHSLRAHLQCAVPVRPCQTADLRTGSSRYLLDVADYLVLAHPVCPREMDVERVHCHCYLPPPLIPVITGRWLLILVTMTCGLSMSGSVCLPKCSDLLQLKAEMFLSGPSTNTLHFDLERSNVMRQKC